MKVVSSTKLIITSDMTAGSLPEGCADFPPDAKLTVKKDYVNNDWQDWQYYLEAVWSEEK